MIQRIRRLAFETLNSSSLKQDIISDFLCFNKQSKINSQLIDEACKKILSLDQNLKISTIDSLFYDWIKIFPYESGLFKNDYTEPCTYDIHPNEIGAKYMGDVARNTILYISKH